MGIDPHKWKNVRYAKGLPRRKSQVIETAVFNNPRIAVLQAEGEIASLDMEQFRSSLYPQVFLEGTASSGEDIDGTPGQSDELEAKLVLQWKLLDGGIRQARVMELSERAAEKFAEEKVIVREVTEQVDISWARLHQGRAQVEAIRKQVEQNRKLVNAYRDEYALQ